MSKDIHILQNYSSREVRIVVEDNSEPGMELIPVENMETDILHALKRQRQRVSKDIHILKDYSSGERLLDTTDLVERYFASIRCPKSPHHQMSKSDNIPSICIIFG